MTAPNRTRVIVGALAFLIGGLQYVTLEAIAAAAWRDPVYSYTYNYISDLGAPGAEVVYLGRDIHSPLAAVMNTAFVLEGLLVALGAILLMVLLHGVARWAFVAFALLHAVGIVLVGFFPETVGGGLGVFHTGGAYLAIVFSNLLALTVGLSARRMALPAWFRVTSLALPVLGFASEAALFSGLGDGRLDGLWERGGVYSFTVFQILFGLVVLAGATRKPRRDRVSSGL
ncbi:putative membrane protein [Conyzicola lurida]|uniref:Putative membrane protein n=1 Tax=Conyzicola lurida TaxID=1172621 RepID=A0A841ARS8_9MICO|nr:DUF998 domain-containing protein [Conyzicola lurida]MBB5844129.1 putative membrane protein [Conyzicola lurida]